jgi:hypothetical protein
MGHVVLHSFDMYTDPSYSAVVRVSDHSVLVKTALCSFRMGQTGLCKR